MNPITDFLGSNATTMVLGLVLMIGVLLFAWFDRRRTSRLPHLGTIMVKNRLNGSN